MPVVDDGSSPPPCTRSGFRRVLEHVRATSPSVHSALHGDRHWRRVATLGAHIAARVAGCDPWLVLLFALLHDSRRKSDGHDPEHGPRAAELVRALIGPDLHLDPSRAALLESACFGHTNGGVSVDATVGSCWDADRLDLWRVGLTPDRRYLSTGAALEPATIAWSAHAPAKDWDALYDDYERVSAADGSARADHHG